MQKIHEKIEYYKKILIQLLNSKEYTIEEIHNDWRQAEKMRQHNVQGVYMLLSPRKDSIYYVGRTHTKTIADRVGNQHVYGGSGSDLRNMLSSKNSKIAFARVLACKCKYLKIETAIGRAMFEHFAIAVLDPILTKQKLRKQKHETDLP